MDRLAIIEKDRPQARKSLQALVEVLSRASFLPGAPGDEQLARSLEDAGKEVSFGLLTRLGERFDTALVVVFSGGTGVGKSTLLNTVADRRISDTSVKRPCTTAPLIYHHRVHRETVEELSFLPGYEKGTVEAPPEGKGVVLVSHDDDSLGDIILVDSPDFDSVLNRNRDLSQDILRIAHVVIYVVNPAKYADEEVWQVIRKIAAESRPVLFVFNQADELRGDGDDPAEHFGELLAEEDFDRDFLTCLMRSGTSKEGKIPDSNLAKKLLGAIDQLIPSGRKRNALGQALNDGWERVRGSLEKKVLPALRSDAYLIEAMQSRMENEWGEAERRILEEVRIEQAADRRKTSEILQANLLDLVGRLERTLLGPLSKLFDYLFDIFAKPLDHSSERLQQQLAKSHEGNREAIRRHLREGSDRLNAFLEGDARGNEILNSPAWKSLLLSADEIDQLYKKMLSDYETWLRDQFDSLVWQAKSVRSIQLAAANFVYIVLLAGATYFTAGAALLLGGPLAPLVNRLLVKWIDLEVVEEIEKKGQKRFMAIFPEMVLEQTRRGVALCESLSTGSGTAAEIGRLLDELDSRMVPLVDALCSGEEE